MDEKNTTTKYIVFESLLWRDNTGDTNNIVDCPEGDRIAHANKFFPGIEHLIRHFSEGTVLKVNVHGQIISMKRPGEKEITEFDEDFEPLNCTCRACGYTWRRGQDGSHRCAVIMGKTIENLRLENSTLKEMAKINVRDVCAANLPSEYRFDAADLSVAVSLSKWAQEKRPDLPQNIGITLLGVITHHLNGVAS